MITVYVDAAACLEPGAADRLRHLAESGHELVLVAALDDPAAGFARWAGHLSAPPDDAAPGSWFVIGDPARCGDRRSNLRTMLVGPRADTQRPTRCDSTVRDLRAAVLAILAADAMT